MTEAVAPAPAPEQETSVGGWWVDPDRTLVAVSLAGPDRRIDCRRLDRAGRAATTKPHWSLADPDDWDVLGWAGRGILTLWKRPTGGCGEILLVDVGKADEPPARYSVAGRPVACRVDRSGRVAVVVAMSRGGRPQLWWHLPQRQAYQPITGDDPFQGFGAWDDEGRVLALTVGASDGSPTLVVYRDEGHGPVATRPAWPDGVRPVSAAGRGGGRLGLTGIGDAGQRVPGVLELRTGAVLWFTGQPGYSSADVAPSGRHLLAAAGDGESFHYRVLGVSGEQIGVFGNRSALVSDPCLTADGVHAIALHQSPVAPPSLRSWDVRTGVSAPAWDGGSDARRARTETRGPLTAVAASTMSWTFRRSSGAGRPEMPEWVFRPGGGGHGGAVLFLHGGPGGRLRQAYDPVIAALVGAGWIVVGPNYPGSSGYGAEYLGQSRGDWGGADAAAVEGRLKALSEAVTGPVCLYGQSYGGYLALLVAAALPELVDRVAVWAPVTDLPALLGGSTGSQRRWLEQELGELAADPGRLRRRSPASRLSGLRRSHLLVGHGRFDDRCPVEQSRSLMRLLRPPHDGPGSIRYLEDPACSHTPLSWRSWTDAAVSHFAAAARPRCSTAGGAG